jgi:membrane associated rhomboid family serine protease
MKRSKPKVPVWTLILIAVNLGIGLFSIRSEEWLALLGFTPAHASIGTVLSSLFVHAHPAHLAWNMAFLWFFGWHVEEVLKPLRFLTLYFVSGVGSVFCHWFFGVGFQPGLQDQALVGASGAISGLVGYFAVRFYRVRVRLFWWQFNRWGLLMPIWVAILLWVGWQMFGAMFSAGTVQMVNIGYWAHLGGFACGLLIAVVWDAGATGERELLLQEAENSLRQVYPGVALQCLEPLTRGANADPDALRLSGEAWEYLDDKELASDFYVRAIKIFLAQNPRNYEQASLCARRMLLMNRLHELDLPYTERLAAWHTQRGEYQIVAKIYKSLLDKIPDLPNRANLLLRYADLYRTNLNNPREARIALEEIIEKHPNAPEGDLAKFRLKQL